NILKATGHTVETEFYVNDAGRQIELLKQSVLAAMEGRQPPEGGYQGDYINDLAAAAKAKGITEDQLTDFLIKTVLDEQKKDMAAIKVKFDSFFSEKQLHGKGKVGKAIEVLKANGFTYEKDGAQWFNSEKFGDDKDRVLIRENGEETYFAADIAYHLDKLERGYDKLIDIWGTDHHGYIKRVQAAIQALGYDPKLKLEIIIGQLVSLFRAGEPVRMSKRAGNIITLSEVVDEIGPDATRFFLAMRSPNTHLEFDLEVAKKKSDENPVYYVQYAHARICSIIKKACEDGIKLSGKVDVSLLKGDSERALIKRLWDYPDELILSAEHREVHRLTNYLRDVAGLLHSFYHQCRVVGENKDLTLARLALVDSARIVFTNALGILGISAPERM
ncbi:MAG: arginine--tRNA ligase, partial [bacterium]